MHTIFVYGTLLSGEHNNHFLKNAEYVGMGYVHHVKMSATVWGYPVLEEGDGKVIGEVWKVDDDAKQRIDWLESDYVEKPVVVCLMNENIIDAGAYFGARFTENDIKEVIESGDWKEYRRSN